MSAGLSIRHAHGPDLAEGTQINVAPGPMPRINAWGDRDVTHVTVWVDEKTSVTLSGPFNDLRRILHRLDDAVLDSRGPEPTHQEELAGTEQFA